MSPHQNLYFLNNAFYRIGEKDILSLIVRFENLFLVSIAKGYNKVDKYVIIEKKFDEVCQTYILLTSKTKFSFCADTCSLHHRWAFFHAFYHRVQILYLTQFCRCIPHTLPNHRRRCY